MATIRRALRESSRGLWIHRPEIRDPYGTDTFLRFGVPPKSGGSRIGLDAGFMSDVGFAPGAREKGVSVYFTMPKDGGWYWVSPDEKRARYGLPGNYREYMATQYFDGAIEKGDIFLVTGDLIPRPDVTEDAWDDIEELRGELEFALEDLSTYEEEGDEEGADAALEEVESLQQRLERAPWTFESGSDGEPLLRNVRVLQRIGPEQVKLGRKTSLADIMR